MSAERPVHLFPAAAAGRPGAQRPPLPGAPAAIWLPWMLRLRWLAAAGQTCAILVVHFAFDLALPLGALAGVVAVTVGTNFVFVSLRDRLLRAPRFAVSGILALDVALLTALLYLGGGPANPFSVLYLVHVGLAALVLGLRGGLAIAALSAVLYAALFYVQSPVDLMHAMHGERGVALHLAGMWVATAVAAGVLGYFLGNISAALRDREEAILQLQHEAARAEKLVSLSTLAAGAAHELGSPLGTIAVLSRELEHALAARSDAARLVDDVRLVRSEVERCRSILGRLGEGAGGVAGEGPERVSVSEILSEVMEALAPEDRPRLQLPAAALDAGLSVPRRAVAQALTSLVRNALLATPSGGVVSIRTESRTHRVRFEICDRGDGMDADVLSRAGEPFFTTRPPGQGMGLGLFLARAVAEQLGGTIGLDSTPGCGTTAWLEVPTSLAGEAA